MATLRLITTLVQFDRTAKVYRNSEWDEYQTKFFIDGKHITEGDCFTDDKTDAMDTAQHWVNKTVPLSCRPAQ